MVYPIGAAKPGPLRVDFDRRLKLEFHGSKLTWDTGLLAYRELEHALAMPDEFEQWSLTTLCDKLFKIGTKVVRHGRYVTFQLAEIAVPWRLSADILQLIDGLWRQPAPT